MEVVNSPLNLAHQQSRKADRLLAAGKYEEAIDCHGKAAGLLEEAMTLTECEQARLSMELQRDNHVKQQRLIEEKWKRARRETKPRVLQSTAARAPEQPPAPHSTRGPEQPPAPHSTQGPEQPPAPHSTRGPERDYDTWLYLLQNKGAAPEPCHGSKAQKDDKTRLEEQQTTIADLRKLVEQLMGENEKLKEDKESLRAENRRLRREEQSEVWVMPQPGDDRKAKDIPIPHLPPLEMPTQDISLEDLPALELPEDIQNELRELIDRDEL